MTARETAVAALHTAIAASVSASLALVQRNTALPEEMGAVGLVIVRDGNPGQPEFTHSPAVWHYEHTAEVECFAQGNTDTARDTAIDAILAAVGTAISADRTLSGAVEYAQEGAPMDMTDIGPDGANPVRGTVVPITLFYSTSGPLA